MKRLIKLLSAALCLTILLSASLVGAVAFSLSDFGFGDKDTATADEAEVFKDETVYVMAKADGTVDKIIVGDWIKNNKGADTITDLSTVGDIENVKTDASFTLDDNNMRVWEAKDEDLHLQGTGTQPLPVDLTVTYSLDGSVISPEQLAGKSGKVTIRFDYTNNAYETVKIDGKDERVYVPFLMMSGMMLDSKKFSNVTVTNGKVISDGDHISNLKTQLDSYSTFHSGLKTYTGGVGSASEGAQRLHGGTTQIRLCSAALKDGASALSDGTQQLSSGADALKNGVLTLKNGVPALIDGVSQLRDGSMKLSDGLKQFNEEGICKITSLLKDDFGGLAERIKAIIRVSQNYKSYSGLTDQMDGEVKFIYKTAEIE